MQVRAWSLAVNWIESSATINNKNGRMDELMRSFQLFWIDVQRW